MTILHVEDDPGMAKLVSTAFRTMGFQGEILHAHLIADAEAILTERESRKESIELFLADMQLPDGTGLDVVRRVKESPVWFKTPVIVLSGETAPELIDHAYALGANCYLPKLARGKGAFESIQALYQCWIDVGLLPKPSFDNHLQEALSKGISLRARIAQFYLGLAKAWADDQKQEEFWLDRALIECNASNLLAFFQGQIGEGEVPAGLAERTMHMQQGLEKTLTTAEALLATHPSPQPADIYPHVLEILEAWDEEIFAGIFAVLFPKNPAVTVALKARAVCQIRELANHVLRQAQDPDFCRRGEALLLLADRLAAAVCSAGATTQAPSTSFEGRSPCR